VIAESGLGDHRPCILRAETSYGSVVRDYSSPNQREDRESRSESESIQPSFITENHLVHHIDKSLGVGPREVSLYLDLIVV